MYTDLVRPGDTLLLRASEQSSFKMFLGPLKYNVCGRPVYRLRATWGYILRLWETDQYSFIDGYHFVLRISHITITI